MKYIGIALLALVVLAFCAVNSFAQAPLAWDSPFGDPQPTLFNDPNIGAGWLGSYAKIPSALRVPKLYAAWSPNASLIKLAATADAYQDAANNGYGEGTIRWSTGGLWLGLSLPVQAGERLSADLQGWYFLPANNRVSVDGHAWGLDNAEFTSIGLSERMNINTTWFAIDLEGSYSASSEFAFLAGVRYDYLQGTISFQDSLEAELLARFPGLRTKLDVNLNSIFPYLGARTILSAGQGSLTFALKGFPWAISVADVHPKSGYFAEVFASYEVSPLRDLSLSLFAKADLARAVFEEASQVENVFNRPTDPQNASVQQTLPVTWQQYLFGAVATLNFALPLL